MASTLSFKSSTWCAIVSRFVPLGGATSQVTTNFPESSACLNKEAIKPIPFPMETFQLASGVPAGGQTFEKFDKQVLRAVSIYSKAVGSLSISDLRAAPMPDGEGYSTFFIKPEPCRMGKAQSVPTIVRPPHNIHNTSNTDSLTSYLAGAFTNHRGGHGTPFAHPTTPL
ncbi:hypothetical protein [Desulfoluna limicola]|uniref:hypothetical protein n=1 Tax=Desulfoluna limicola TaxID=2810562 RepID=UPI001F3BFC90|nr:hypothetical protein [Desulfoluna limicola]